MPRKRLFSVKQVAAQWCVGKFTLQHLFSSYVGVAPKWVINRLPRDAHP